MGGYNLDLILIRKMKLHLVLLLALAILLPMMMSVNAQADDGVEVSETPNDKGERKIELEDMQLWKNMDLNKDGRLTIAEYERFARSPNAQRFVRNMKEH